MAMILVFSFPCSGVASHQIFGNGQWVHLLMNKMKILAQASISVRCIWAVSNMLCNLGALNI